MSDAEDTRNINTQHINMWWLLVLAIFPLACLSYSSLRNVEFMIRTDCANIHIYALPEMLPFVSLEECVAMHWAHQDRQYAE